MPRCRKTGESVCILRTEPKGKIFVAQYRLNGGFGPVAIHIYVKEKNVVVREVSLMAATLPTFF